MPREKDIVYGVGYTETEPEPPQINPSTHRRNFDLARQIVRDAVPPGKKARKSDLVKLIRGWRADRKELAPLISLKKQIDSLELELSEATDPGIISNLESSIAAKKAEFESLKPPDFISAPAKTIKRLRNNQSIAGPLACKSISLNEANAIVDEIITEREASWTFLNVDLQEP